MREYISFSELPEQLQQAYHEHSNQYSYLNLQVVKCKHLKHDIGSETDHHYYVYSTGNGGYFLIMHLPILALEYVEQKITVNAFGLEDLKTFLVDSEEGKQNLDYLVALRENSPTVK